METKAKTEAYNLLKNCMQTFLNNTANSGSTTDNAVQISFEEFKKYTQDKQRYEEELTENYKKNHDIPRKEKELAYNIYLIDRERLRDEWKANKDMRHLLEYLQFKKPDNIELANDPIYTKYVKNSIAHDDDNSNSSSSSSSS
jgi:hypothetical protein